MSIPTPHIEASAGAFAPTVLMPGDPLRAKVIAQTFLDGAKEVNSVRGMLGYTGSYKKKPVSVMGSGMGMPSIGIYSWELYNEYGVQNIIRVGSAGGIAPGVKLRDVLVGLGCCTNSNFGAQYKLPGLPASICSYKLLLRVQEAADSLSIPVKVGSLLSSDIFYNDDNADTAVWAKLGVLGVEMEAYALYLNAIRAGRDAIALCTVSDLPLTGESLTSAERQNSFFEMIEIALTAAE
jgi:purine-nucleoside phosphorylase